jgi:2-keto-4-pentenoate hydratase/2-oxohepta-3-ene-1,7-dioic acid hydratase in catechol pathway
VKILCVGQNYARHVKELGSTAPEAPLWFWKPGSAIIRDGDEIELPQGIGAIHHEVEMAVRIGKVLRRETPASTLRHLDGVTVANDVTARDLQSQAKKLGRPWDQSKGYDTFLPLGAWQPVPTDLQSLQLRLSVNGQLRQQGSTRDMTWTVAQLLATASQWTTLHPGDVLLTGTPEGVGPLANGDRIEAELVGIARLQNRAVTAPQGSPPL